jgi:hypothetical protein
VLKTRTFACYLFQHLLSSSLLPCPYGLIMSSNAHFNLQIRARGGGSFHFPVSGWVSHRSCRYSDLAGFSVNSDHCWGTSGVAFIEAFTLNTSWRLPSPHVLVTISKISHVIDRSQFFNLLVSAPGTNHEVLVPTILRTIDSKARCCCKLS